MGWPAQTAVPALAESPSDPHSALLRPGSRLDSCGYSRAVPVSVAAGAVRVDNTGLEEQAVPPCLGCAACCFSKLASYVRVEGSDHARLGERVDELTFFDGNRCYMRMEGGHCAALVVDVAARRFVCSVYETRPAVCRDLERASPQCRAEIHEKDERPRALLHQRSARSLVK